MPFDPKVSNLHINADLWAPRFPPSVWLLVESLLQNVFRTFQDRKLSVQKCLVSVALPRTDRTTESLILCQRRPTDCATNL